MTSPHDIAMQILCWMFNGEQGNNALKIKHTFGSASQQTTWQALTMEYQTSLHR